MANSYRHVASGAPYYDDFVPSKNYMKMLYNPGYALQARELTQSQTYLQNQIASLGSYMFKDGSAVDGAKISYSTSQPCLRISAYDTDGSQIKIEDFVNKEFRGSESGQIILVTDYYIDKSDTSTTKYYVLFSYMGSDIVPGEIFTTYKEANKRTFTSVEENVHNALVAACTEGYLFVDGYFVNVPQSHITISTDSDDTTEYYIGYKITRSIITANEDSTLHDPASGTYNYKAPGADRYQINAELVAYTSDTLPEDNLSGEIDYVTGIIIRGKTLIKDQSYDVNGNIMDVLARRTYEESGSYTVNPWKIQLKEHPTDSSKYIVSVEPGRGYIYGYRVDTLVSQEIEVDKPRTWLTKSNNVTYVSDAIYTYAKYESNSDSPDYNRLSLQARYFPSFLTMETVNVMSGEKGTGNVLGTCKITDLYKQGTYLRVYLTDVQNVLGSFSSARSLVSTSNPDYYVNLLTNQDNHAVIYGTDAPKIIPTGYTMVTPAVTSTDSTAQSNPMEGTINYQFLKTYTSIASKTTTTSITFNTNNDGFEFETTGLQYIYESQTGKHVDITNLVVTVSSNSVTISNQNISEIFEEGHSYVVCGRVNLSSGNIRQKYITEYTETIQVKKGTDKVTLSKEDIIELISVTNGSVDYTEQLTLNNGQTDYLYDYGSISGFSTFNQEANSTTYTISYRYYEHGSVAGPFTAGSYVNTRNLTYQSADNNTDFRKRYPDLYSAIPVYRSTATGTRYKLRDCLDYRVKVSELSNNGLSYFPSARTKMTFSAGVYLPRIDAVWVDKNGNFGITTGIPSQSPETPEEKDGTMTIYYLYNEAYVHGLENVNVQYVDQQRHTMSDITKLKNRITNVENVVSLSLLEQSAVNMQITDDEGFNRYKTGIFADSFGNYNNCDYTNSEWDCTIDSVECSIRPLFECEEHKFDFVSSTTDASTSNVEKNDIILTMKSIGTEIYAQNTALSEQTNIQSLMFHVWNGSLKLTPSVDTWVNDLGQFVVSEEYVDTPQPPTTYRTWNTTNVTDIKQNSSTYSVGRDFHSPGYWVDTYQQTDNYAVKETKTTTETTSYVGSWSANDTVSHMESQDSYMRIRDIEFSLKGMRPGMTIIGTMDGVELNLSENVIHSDGTLTGTFKIPENMTVGTKLVEFYDTAMTSAAYTEYSGNGKTVWANVDRTYIRTWTAITSSNTTTSTNNVYLGSTTTKVSTIFVNEDPIAESFYVDNPNGVMLESIDIYFAKKDPNVNVEVFIVECENGYPSQTMVPFSRVSHSPDEVNVTPIESINANNYPVATNFKFDSPLFLSPETEYAFIIIAPSYNYEIYTSTLGSADLVTGIGIREQPFIGSMFKSQNLRTWTAEQLSDITFRIHKYIYDTNMTSYALFNVEAVQNEFKCAMETLCANTFIPNQTNIEYYYKWKNENAWVQFNNKEDVFNNVVRKLENADNSASGPSLQIRMKMTTLDSNLSPMVDLEQVYGIFTNNIVKQSDDENYAYKCGTYISNSVSLENPSSDLRVIVDAILPNESGIKVSFRTTTYQPIYTTQANSGFFVDSEAVDNSVGKVMQLYYYNSTLGKFVLPKSTIQSLCIVSGHKGKKIYLKSISSPDDFKNINNQDSAEENYPDLNNTKITAICLLPIQGTEEIVCPTWTAKSFNAGDYVLYDGYMWQALINTIAANTPSSLSIAWKKIDGIKVISEIMTDDEVTWRPMTKDISLVPTSVSESFTEYTYVPELDVETEFTDFAIRIDMYSQNEVDVPRFKNLRAIAVV